MEGCWRPWLGEQRGLKPEGGVREKGRDLSPGRVRLPVIFKTVVRQDGKA